MATGSNAGTSRGASDGTRPTSTRSTVQQDARPIAASLGAQSPPGSAGQQHDARDAVSPPIAQWNTVKPWATAPNAST